MIDFAHVFVWVMAIAIAIDLFLVLVLKVKSISMATWIASQNHPTLCFAGALATAYICYLLLDTPWEMAFMAGMGAHLFSGIPVTVAQAKKIADETN